MMKSVKTAMLVAVMVGVGSVAQAEQTPSVEYGKKLFNDPSLGGATGSKSCATCAIRITSSPYLFSLHYATK